MAEALYPDQIARAIRRTVEDHSLFESAKMHHWRMIQEKANWTALRKRVPQYYHRIAEESMLWQLP